MFKCVYQNVKYIIITSCCIPFQTLVKGHLIRRNQRYRPYPDGKPRGPEEVPRFPAGKNTLWKDVKSGWLKFGWILMKYWNTWSTNQKKHEVSDSCAHPLILLISTMISSGIGQWGCYVSPSGTLWQCLRNQTPGMSIAIPSAAWSFPKEVNL